MYREDDAARGARAHALIGEIAELERQKVARVELEQRLEAAREELATLQVLPAPPPPRERAPSLLVHLFVFAAAAGAMANELLALVVSPAPRAT
jgi:hypothetical protein